MTAVLTRLAALRAEAGDAISSRMGPGAMLAGAEANLRSAMAAGVEVRHLIGGPCKPKEMVAVHAEIAAKIELVATCRPQHGDSGATPGPTWRA